MLSRKAHVLNQWYEEREKAGYVGVEVLSESGEKGAKQRIRWKVKSDEERESLGKMIRISFFRPFCELCLPKQRLIELSDLFSVLLFTEPVVFWFSLWISFSWAVLYLTFTAVPLVFSVSHGFDVQQSGAVFACKSTGLVFTSHLVL